MTVSENAMKCFACARHDCNDVDEEFSVFPERINVLPTIHSKKLERNDVKGWDKDNKRKEIVSLILAMER